MSTADPLTPIEVGEGDQAEQENLLRSRGKPISRTKLVGRRLIRRPQFWIGAGLLALLVLWAVLGNLINLYGPQDQDITALNQPPSAEHWFGTDQLGRDIYAQTVSGIRKSLLIGIIAGPLATVLAAIIGSIAGYLGGKVEAVMMWFCNLLLTLPVFFILMVLSPVLQKVGWFVLSVIMALFGWMIMSQIVKNQTKSLREREFVKAARYMGVPTPTILVRHILPNVASLLIIDACLGVNGAILAETALSYFGLGVQPPDVSLGTLLAKGSSAATTRPWLFLAPAITLIVLLTAVNLLGDALRDAIDPTSGANRG